MSIADKLSVVAENVPKVYEAGYKSFWDGYLERGARKYYGKAFYGWSDTDFQPKYDMTPLSANYMFWEFNIYKYREVDLQELLDRQGVTLDFSHCVGMERAFSSSYISRIGVIDTNSLSELKGTFAGAKNLKTIDELILKADGSQTFVNTFIECERLMNIKITGTIGQSGFYILSPNLTADSAKSIITALSDSTSGLAITLSSNVETNYNNVYGSGAWDNLVATKTNWTISLK